MSTRPDRDDARSIEVLHAALNAGITFFDTANVYCHDNSDIGHNERLIARALSTWPGDRSSVVVATKGGLTRPKGRWVPDGRAKSLRASCEASRKALDVETIDLYQLHAVDPSTPFRTSVRALAALHREKVITNVGLCNVTVRQIDVARDHVPIAAVQVELNPFAEEYFRTGVVEYCRDEQIPIVAARPLCGDRIDRLRKHPKLLNVARRLGATPEEIAIAWLRDLWNTVIVIPGVSTQMSVESLVRTKRLTLTDQDRAELDRAFPAGRLLRVPRSERRPTRYVDGEVVLVMGFPGSGKSTIAKSFVEKGYYRLNRDIIGGSLNGLVPKLARGLEDGHSTWVLDNTYPSRSTRNRVIECAWEHGMSVRCIWLEGSIEDAQISAVDRMIRRLGHLPQPGELKHLGKSDSSMFGPDALYRYQRALEPPSEDEGFSAVTKMPHYRPTLHGAHRALFLDIDAFTSSRKFGRTSTATPSRQTVQTYFANGWLILGFAWRPEIETANLARGTVEQELDDLRQWLGVEIDVSYCPHRAGPLRCWCRIPMPGLILDLCYRHSVDATRSVLIGDSSADRAVARKLEMAFEEHVNWAG